VNARIDEWKKSQPQWVVHCIGVVDNQGYIAQANTTFGIVHCTANVEEAAATTLRQHSRWPGTWPGSVLTRPGLATLVRSIRKSKRAGWGSEREPKESDEKEMASLGHRGPKPCCGRGRKEAVSKIRSIGAALDAGIRYTEQISNRKSDDDCTMSLLEDVSSDMLCVTGTDTYPCVHRLLHRRGGENRGRVKLALETLARLGLARSERTVVYGVCMPEA
jgi:hypothetical protein